MNLDCSILFSFIYMKLIIEMLSHSRGLGS